jgi:hypothetical protein
MNPTNMNKLTPISINSEKILYKGLALTRAVLNIFETIKQIKAIPMINPFA